MFNKKNAIVFGGQGAQFISMGKDLYDKYSRVRLLFELSSSIAGYNVAKACFGEDSKILNETTKCQICIITLELANYLLLLETNIKIDAVAGFSLGEYAALVAANVADIETVLNLVNWRAQCMENRVADNTGVMYAIINPDCELINNICYEIGVEHIGVSNYNAYNQVVVSVSTEKKQIFLQMAKKHKQIIVRLNCNYPFHHPLMKDAADDYFKKIANIKFTNPSIPIYSNVTGNRIYNAEQMPDLLYKQIFNPVLWIDIINNMLASGICHFYEISTRPMLSKFIQNISNGQVETIDVNKYINSLY